MDIWELELREKLLEWMPGAAGLGIWSGRDCSDETSLLSLSGMIVTEQQFPGVLVRDKLSPSVVICSLYFVAFHGASTVLPDKLIGGCLVLTTPGGTCLESDVIVSTLVTPSFAPSKLEVFTFMQKSREIVHIWPAPESRCSETETPEVVPKGSTGAVNCSTSSSLV